MTATADPSDRTLVLEPTPSALARAEGVELLGEVHGSGYKEGAALVRRADGQMVHLGPLMYALLEEADGRRSTAELAHALCERLGRACDEEHVVAIAQKLAAQGLLAGSEHRAPPRRNPLLALRFKVLVTNPVWTRRLTAPFAVLFRPWLMWPILAAFVAVCWFVLIHKGVAGATAEAFHSPGLLLLVFALAVGSAGFHELGHAAACRYGGATPGGMGMGLYMVWPAFYTEVTDAYRLPRRDRLRVDLGGLYFNCVVAVATLGVWLAWHVDALLLLVALQLLQMVKQLSPVIRADGYHILSDATGIPDLYSHMGPTLRRLLPWRRREPSALTGRARAVVTLWVLIVVPVLLALTLGAVLLLPRMLATAWESGRTIGSALPHEVAHGQVLLVLASLLRLFALALPVGGSVLVAQRILRTVAGKADGWTGGSPARRGALLAATGLAAAGAAWAWWPAGQYQPVRAADAGTLAGFGRLLSAPATAARPELHAAPVSLAPGAHLAVAMIPVGGASQRHPALFVVPGTNGGKPVAIVSTSAPDPAAAPTAHPGATPAPDAAAPTPTTTDAAPTTTAPATTTAPTTTDGSASAPPPVQAQALPFTLPSAPGPGGTQAVAVGTKDGAVTYDIAYAVVTVAGGKPVTNTNGAFALASCTACTTVAVSFQVVLVVGRSKVIAPIDAAGALNVHCPACVTTAVADQLVVTLTKQPSQQLVAQLEAALRQLDALPALGAAGTPGAIAAQVTAVQQQVEDLLNASGLVATPTTTSGTTTGAVTTATTTGTTTGSGGTVPATITGSTATTTASHPSSAGTGTTTPAPAATSPAATTTAPAGTTTAAATTSAPATTTATGTTTDAATTTAEATTTRTGPTTTAPAATTTTTPGG